MIRLAVIRHGRTEWNRDGKIQGHRDIPLEPDAVKELADYRLPILGRIPIPGFVICQTGVGTISHLTVKARRRFGHGLHRGWKVCSKTLLPSVISV